MTIPAMFRRFVCLVAILAALSGQRLAAACFVLDYSMGMPYCGNNSQNFVSGPPLMRLLRFSGRGDTGCGNIRPDSGNYRREVLDLEVWGGVGEHPLVWKRYFNSRPPGHSEFFGGGAGLRHSYQWLVMGDTNSGFTVYYPDGTRYIFTPGTNEVMSAGPAVPDKLIIAGEELALLRQNGWRYRIVNDTNFGYLVVGLWDSQENYYTFDYNTNGHVSRVTEPAGRYLEITYSTNEFPNWTGEIHVARVDGSDGRYVTYAYTNFNQGTEEAPVWVSVLAAAQYGDGTAATMGYGHGAWPLLTNSYEPRSLGGPVHVHLLYWSDWAFFRAEIDPVTGLGTRGIGADATLGLVIVSAGGVVEPIAYSGGLLTSKANGEGGTTTYAYENGDGFLISKTDPLERTTYFTNSFMGNPLAVTYHDTSSESWTRDDLDLVLGHTNPLGQVTAYTRDARHRVTRIDYPDSTYETFTYNTNSQVLVHRQANGGTNFYGYSTNGLKTAATNALGQVTTFTYDAYHRLASVTDARGNTSSNFYDWRGQVTAIVNPDATYKTFGYDTNGNKVAETNELGQVTQFAYDNLRRLTSQTDPLGRTTTFDYAELGGCCGSRRIDGEPAVITSPLTNITVNTFNLAGRKASTILAWGTGSAATNEFYYDDAGNVTITVNPLGNATTNTYDDRNRRLSTTDALGNTTQWVYDAAGNKVKEIRANNTTNWFGYDSRNRLLSQTNALGHVTTYTYDSGGNLASLTDARSNTYAYTYDLLNRKTVMTWPDSSTETWTYDPVGNVTNHATRASQVKSAVFDSRNRETSYSWSDGSPGVTRTYDYVGRLLVQSNSISVISNVFDAAGQLTAETQLPLALNSYWQVQYGYDADGRRVTVAYPGGLTLTNTFTPRGQLESLYTGFANPTATFTYDLAGNRTGKVLENSTTNLLAYDLLGRLTNTTHYGTNGLFGGFNYGYDSVHRRTYMQVDGSLGDVFAYDDTDQVTGVQYDATNPDTTPSSPARTVSYGFDPVGNRTNVTDNGSGTSYTANSLNQYTAVGGASPTYDPNGNLTNYNGWGYVYDAQNRLWGAANSNTTGLFTYDARNRVVSRVVNGTTNYYFYDDWNLVSDRDAAGNALQTYVHGPRIDELIFKTDGSNVVYYHHDALGNVTHLTDSYSRVVERYRYDIYGQASIRDGNGNPLTGTAYGNRFQFTGREYLAAFGLHDYRNRVYLQSWGRFIQTDPIRFDGKDVNIYRYAGNEVVNAIDLGGMMKWRINRQALEKNHQGLKDLRETMVANRDTVREVETRSDTWAQQNSALDAVDHRIADLERQLAEKSVVERVEGIVDAVVDLFGGGNSKMLMGAGLFLGAASQAQAIESGSGDYVASMQDYANHASIGDSAMMELDALDLTIQTQNMFGNWALSLAVYDVLAE